MTLPHPEPGLVVCYSYLWRREYEAGREEGLKDRPCAVVVATEDRNGKTYVLVVPITHASPDEPASALELPIVLKRHLGLDDARSWAVCSESNVFAWPGPDLRRVRDEVAYGMLPPRFFAELKRRFIAQELAAGRRRVMRTE